jgi:hypothetical protein
VKGRIGYVPAPVDKTESSGWLYTWAWGMQKASKKPDKAWEFISWASGKEYEALVGATSGWANVPAGKRASTYDHPQYLKAAAAFAEVTKEAISGADPRSPGTQKSLEAGVATIAHRLSLPVGAKGTKRAPGGYRSRREWHAKTRRLRVLEDRLGRVRADREAGRVRVVRGGRRLLGTRHHLAEAGLTEWRRRWEAGRWFLTADGESGKRFGNETIRITPDGEVMSRHDAASIAIGRRAQGHSIRRRTTPPRTHRSDGCGHRTVQADSGALGREGPRPHIPGPRTRCVPPDAARTRATRPPNTVRGVRSDQEWVQDSLLRTD